MPRMSKCCILRSQRESGDTPCPNDGALPYYDDEVCEACARAMLPEYVLPLETLCALVALDADRYRKYVDECDASAALRERVNATLETLAEALVEVREVAERLRDRVLTGRRS